MSVKLTNILQLFILFFCIFSINFIVHPEDIKIGYIRNITSIDLNGDGKKEQIVTKIYKINDYASWEKLIVLDKNGKKIWESPEWGDIGSPMVFGVSETGSSLPQIINDIDGDGFIEAIITQPQSDVCPPAFDILRWKNNRFSPVKGGTLLDKPAGSGNYSWSVNYDIGSILNQKQRWINKFISVSTEGKYTVEIFSYTGSGTITGDSLHIGKAVVYGDELGFHIVKWIEPVKDLQGKSDSKKIQGQPLLDLLDKHYTAINNKKFKDAYNCRSKEWQSAHSYDEFYSNWESNITIGIRDLEILSQTEKRAEVKIELYSVDDTGNGNKTGIYTGTVWMINEKGDWKINEVQVNEKNN